MAMSTTRQYLIEMLKLYREMPCLWDRKHKDFSNKGVRQKAYYFLLILYRKVEPSATLRTMCKKLQNLKTCYFKELRKVQASRLMATDQNRVYVPTLWYFEALSFLGANYELSESEIIEVEDSDQSSGHEDETQEFTTSTPEPKKLKLELVPQKEEAKPPEATPSSVQMKEEEWEVLGKSLAIQLRDIDRKQLIITQKLISDTIYYAKMGLLSNNSYIVFDRENIQKMQHELPSTSSHRL